MKPDTWINLYPNYKGNYYWTSHMSADIAKTCEEPGAIMVALPCCWKEGTKPTPGNPFEVNDHE